MQHDGRTPKGQQKPQGRRYPRTMVPTKKEAFAAAALGAFFFTFMTVTRKILSPFDDD